MRLFTSEDIEAIQMPLEDWLKIHDGHGVYEEPWAGPEDWTVCICNSCKAVYVTDFNR